MFDSGRAKIERARVLAKALEDEITEFLKSENHRVEQIANYDTGEKVAELAAFRRRIADWP